MLVALPSGLRNAISRFLASFQIFIIVRKNVLLLSGTFYRQFKNRGMPTACCFLCGNFIFFVPVFQQSAL